TAASLFLYMKNGLKLSTHVFPGQREWNDSDFYARHVLNPEGADVVLTIPHGDDSDSIWAILHGHPIP
ncbi:MAG: hypothetical protein MKZ56_07840, partial [Candidatus Thalassarchaeum sp.]|nr:hypothetical protein [Candidatus Thalassarchaeum sp.]